MLDLGPRLRLVVGAAWLALQGALVATAAARPDAAFGFRMFPEASTLNVHLSRRVDAATGHGTVLVPVVDGEWVARNRFGEPHRIKWRERVREPALTTFDRTIFASYGADAQLMRLRAALDDVASHIADDAETREIVLEVDVKKNGRDPYVARMASVPR